MNNCHSWLECQAFIIALEKNIEGQVVFEKCKWSKLSNFKFDLNFTNSTNFVVIIGMDQSDSHQRFKTINQIPS
jgi:hypothetical protein